MRENKLVKGGYLMVGQKKLAVAGLAIIIIIAALLALMAQAPSYPEKESPRPFRGKEDAGIVVQEFADFECPACIAVSPIVGEIQEEYMDEARFEYRHFPLASHPDALQAAVAAECANDFNLFWEFHDKLYEENYARLLQEQRPALDNTTLINTAGELGINRQEFTACIYSRTKDKIIQVDKALGESTGINATPTFVVDGEPIKKEMLSEIIEALKEKLRQKTGK